MDKRIEQLMSGINNQEYNLDITKLLLAILKLNIVNKNTIDFILNLLIDIKESVKGKTDSEIDEIFEDKISQIFSRVDESTEKAYHEILAQILS